MAKRQKRKWRTLRFRKGDPAHNLLAAASAWIRANGGTDIVLGGIEVQDWGEGLGNYRVAIRALGKRPVASSENKKP